MGVSNLLPVSYISVAGRVGDTVTGTATCEKSRFLPRFLSLVSRVNGKLTGCAFSRKDAGLYHGSLLEFQGRASGERKPYKVYH